MSANAAPCRAFLQERQATAATGGSWLFFGDRRLATDFRYCEELTGFLESGVLIRLNTAFSRDRRPKGPQKFVYWAATPAERAAGAAVSACTAH